MCHPGRGGQTWLPYNWTSSYRALGQAEETEAVQNFDPHYCYQHEQDLTHWGLVTRICVCKLTIIGWDNGLLPGRRQAIFLTNARILLIWCLEAHFNEILIKIHTFSFKKIHLTL